jgi:hypothetical protein
MKVNLIKTEVKGLCLTIEGKPWHKAAKREIKPTASGKVRFNGKVYDLQKLTIAEKPKTKKIKPVLKKVETISPLQKKGFRKTTINGLYLTKEGKAYNYITKNELRASVRGNVTINGKAYNLAKLVLQTFKSTPVRNGNILFLNGNKKDFHCDNLQYLTGTHYKAPSEHDIIKCIRLYFAVDKKLNRQNIHFKLNLKAIALKRRFVEQHKGKEFDLFLQWLELLSNSKAMISTDNGYNAVNGSNAINKYLALLVNECLQDHENGLLQIIDFLPKPLTATEKNKRTNELLEKSGFSVRIPLRKTRTK